jgi:hypothetical protein
MPAATVWDGDHSSIVGELDPHAPPPSPPRELSLRHETYPYEANWPVGDWPKLRAIAGGYLFKVAHRFGLPAASALIDPASGLFRHLPGTMQLAWLPVSPSADPSASGMTHPRRSFWARRYESGGGGAPVDLRLVLLAVPSTATNKENAEIGSRLAIVLTARVLRGVPPTTGTWKVWITGSSCSAGLAHDLGPSGIVFSKALGMFFVDTELVKATLRSHARSHLNMLPSDDLWFEGYRPRRVSGDVADVEFYFNLPRPADDSTGIAYAVTARAKVRSESDIEIVSLEKTPLVACNVGLLKRDLYPMARLRQRQGAQSQPGPQPLSRRRASRAPDVLSAYCDNAPPVVFNLDASGNLVDDAKQVSVMQSRLVNPNSIPSGPGRGPGFPEVANLALRDPRTDQFGAVGGYANARALFDRMRAYGLQPQQYFKFAALPLHIRYRETIHPGPGKDGKTMNAAVDYDPPTDEFGGGWTGNPQDLKPLQARFALADVKRSLSRREPLSMAVEPRWTWHEYGHVLLAAATGGLELPFVHSPGDALAAIACDPESRLVTMLGGRLRGATFPWAHVGRRHDRSPRLGWSWAGTFHRPGQFISYTSNRFRKGYHSEQILSTSLFTLYRALGGDTFVDPKTRRAAADYVLYLIMRAIQLLPPATAGSAQTPEQIVNTLIAADTGTSLATSGPLKNKAGGWARKVIRWAFENQGLYAGVGPGVIHNAPGLPPQVDVFIDDERPDSDSVRPRGGYVPVALDWAPAAKWLARPGELQVAASGAVRVNVWNRGTLPANAVKARVWYALAPSVNNPPPWNAAAWTEIFSGNSGPQVINPGGSILFGPFNGVPTAPGRRYLVLASASCADDISNIEAPFPVATSSTPILDLVAGDNNIGLRVHTT